MRSRTKDSVPETVGEKLAKADIRLILFDLDDTLIKTHELFKRKVGEAVKYIARQSNLDGETVRKRIGVHIADAHRNIGVPPEIWDEVARNLTLDFSPKYEQLFRQGTEIIKGVYTIAPQYHYGARRVIEELAKQPVQMGLITHANEKWTQLKISKRQLNRYFRRIKIVDERGRKDAGQWSQAISEFGVNPDESLAVGDNLANDIMAAAQAGVRKLVWVNDERGWNEFKNGKLPEGTVTTKRIRGFFEALSQL